MPHTRYRQILKISKSHALDCIHELDADELSQITMGRSTMREKDELEKLNYLNTLHDTINRTTPISIIKKTPWFEELRERIGE